MLNIEPWSIIWLTINLIVLYVIMRLVFVKPLKNIINKRNAIIRDGLKNAAESEKKAKAMELEWNDRLESVQTESAQMMAKARSDAASEYQRLVADARTEAERIINDARADMEQERSKTIEELKGEIAGIALDATKKVLENSDLTNINSSLYEMFLTETGDGNDADSN